MTDFSPVVSAEWVAEHLADDDLLLADVRGPNAHMRAHLPGSIPLVLGAPAQVTDHDVVEAFASEVGLRLRRHGVTGEERLVLYDGGDCVAAASVAQVAELAGHPRVAVLAGGLSAWQGEVQSGVVVLDKIRAELTPRLDAFPTWQELFARLDDPSLAVLDVRRQDEYSGAGGYPCDPRQGHIPGARHVEVMTLFAGPGLPRPADEVHALAQVPAGGEVVTYCHSGSRSGLAMMALRAAGHRARNYVGSWHEWSRHSELPMER
jgi:thiosulfate/3-mercaptopyruvate sulfurtransferase